MHLKISSHRLLNMNFITNKCFKWISGQNDNKQSNMLQKKKKCSQFKKLLKSNKTYTENKKIKENFNAIDIWQDKNCNRIFNIIESVLKRIFFIATFFIKCNKMKRKSIRIQFLRAF